MGRRAAFLFGLLLIISCSDSGGSRPDADQHRDVATDGPADVLTETEEDDVSIEASPRDRGQQQDRTRPDLLVDSPASCEAIAQSYEVTLMEAKTCDPVVPMPQCNMELETELPCPCTTYVNEHNATLVSQLQDLKQQWEQLDCTPATPCAAVACPEPSKGNCQPTSASQARCVDD